MKNLKWAAAALSSPPMASSTSSRHSSAPRSPRSKAHNLYPIRTLWPKLFEELAVMQHDNWATAQTRKDIRALRQAMNVKENVLNLSMRAQMLSDVASYLAAKIAALEEMQDDIYAADDNEYAGGYEFALQRLYRLEQATLAWQAVYA